jgi:Flp pilus assembly protein TadD
MDKPTDAIPFLTQALDLDPQDASAPLYLGYAYYALNEYAECVTYFGKVVELDPYNQLALNNLGYAYYLNGQLAEAEKIFIQGGDAGSERSYYNLGMVRLLQGNEAKAWEAYEEATELDPRGSQISDHLQDLEKAKELHPEQAAILSQAAEKLEAHLTEYPDETGYDDEADDGSN